VRDDQERREFLSVFGGLRAQIPSTVNSALLSKQELIPVTGGFGVAI
jgi:hypothetical protein